MGLLSRLLTFPLEPVRGAVWVARQALAQAEREYYDPAPVRQALADLNEALRTGEIDQETFDQHEAALLARLEELARQRHRTS
ncbi:gas vesicle protein GvpG [Streptomyces omiyaensis]|uniref:Gas vesicle protein GvpG n=1 Tax=Streptomyces omiyaensis TaxID=68247 RepID=A0ABW7BW95_9ACTN|nr:gas vesicle protein GvpG [Streptomyces omiyaensis]GGY57712.1 gas vesicle protein [Streptomyces omiyaensis]